MQVMANVVIIAFLGIIGLSCVADASSSVFPVWVEGADSGFSPSERTFHDVVQDSHGDLWLFGGFDVATGEPLNDLYKMTVRNNYTWTQVDTSASVAVPSPRGEFCWAIDDNDNIFLFGGSATTTYSADKPVFGDLWMFNTSSLIWTVLRNSSDRNLDGRNSPGAGTVLSHPGPRVLMTCWFNEETKEFWMYGGYFYFSFYGDVWSYAIDSGIWSWSSGRADTGLYSDSDVEVGVPYVDKMPGSLGQAVAAKDLDGHVWIYGGWVGSNYGNQLWRFKMATLEWTFFGGNFTTESLESVRLYGRYNEIGTFNAFNYPPGNLYGALVYAGNDKLAFLTGSFFTTELYSSQQLWYYNIVSNEWALMYVVIGDDWMAANRGTFQQSDPSANIGTRIHWGRSRTLGNIWVARGIDTVGGSNATADTLVFPMSLCATDLAPACGVDETCKDHIGWAECVCDSGDSKTCAGPSSAPQSGNSPSSKVPVRAPNSSVVVVYNLALTCMALLLVLM